MGVTLCHKSSTTIQCRQLMDEMREEKECFILTLENTDTFEATGRVELPNIKEVAKQNVAKLFKQKAEELASPSREPCSHSWPRKMMTSPVRVLFTRCPEGVELLYFCDVSTSMSTSTGSHIVKCRTWTS